MALPGVKNVPMPPWRAFLRYLGAPNSHVRENTVYDLYAIFSLHFFYSGHLTPIPQRGGLCIPLRFSYFMYAKPTIFSA